MQSQRLTTRVATSEPRFVGYPAPPPGAPNVLMVVLDDVGFAQLGCFGAGHRHPEHRPGRRAAGCATTGST